MNLKTELIGLVTALNDARIEYALCGGLAVIIHGYPRLTRDIDLLILEEDLDRIREIAYDLGYTLSAGIIPFDIGKPYERRVFRLTKFEGEDFLVLDLLLKTAVLDDVFLDREEYELDGLPMKVVSRQGLAKMKRLSRRPQDLADLSELGEDI